MNGGLIDKQKDKVINKRPSASPIARLNKIILFPKTIINIIIIIIIWQHHHHHHHHLLIVVT